MLHAFGRLMAHHARWFLVGWLVIVAVGFAAVGGLLGNQALFSRLKAGDAPQVPGDARTGQQLLDQTATTGSSVELLLERVQPASGTVRAAVASTAAAVAAMPHVAAVQQPYAVAAVTASTTSGTSRTSRSGPAPRTAPASTIASNPLIARGVQAVLVIADLQKGLTATDESAAAAAVGRRPSAVGRRPSAVG